MCKKKIVKYVIKMNFLLYIMNEHLTTLIIEVFSHNIMINFIYLINIVLIT